ncbi:response regulator transcription factor [Parasulfitobacter algicola]|uniref:Response regulator transcription factor n=1 Tax=Parasulfitobacter algicola TaxID=2614809 RepID=A0ABX2IQP2_9RHOB|nr:response regulator transcription factor [Sulfitobacter algicola]NSX54870.1 response regulator transcription factor [Sulfitobacter algicola]
MTDTQILIVDDDPQIRDLLRIALGKAGYAVRLANDGAAALREVDRQTPDLMVLDIGMPEMDGLEVCRRIRANNNIPILFLTARDDEIDRVLGFEMGADDYVTKPFSPRELVARIKAILKRTNGTPKITEAQKHGTLEIDATRHFCAVAGETVTLTATEMAILAKLMQRPDQISPRPQLTDAVYGTNIHVSDRTLDSHLRNLRRKLADAGCVDAIETVHGVGVRMGECRAT